MYFFPDITVAVALGTDGAGSNNDVSLFAEMHTAALLAKGVAGELEAQPMYHPMSQLVYTQSSHRVSDVWIAGKLLLNNRALTQMSLPALIDKANDWRQRMG